MCARKKKIFKNGVKMTIFFTYFTIICAKSKGQRPYPFCQAKRRSDVFGGWAGKNIFIMTFCENVVPNKIPI